MLMTKNVGKFDNALDEAIYGLSLDGGPDDQAGDVSEAGLWAGIMRGGRELAAAIRERRDEFPNVTESDLDELEQKAGVIISENDQGFVGVKYYETSGELEQDWEEGSAELSGGGDDDGYQANGRYSSITEIKQANADAGLHFFDRDSLRFFRGKVIPKVYGGEYFVTSEQFDERSPRKFTIRRAEENGRISTVGEFQEYNYKEDAVDKIKEWLKTGYRPNGARADDRKRHSGGPDIYATSYCNHGHRMSDGSPVDHECYVLPPAALRAERAGNIEEAQRLIEKASPMRTRHGRPVRHRPNTSIADRRKAGVIEGLTKAEMDSMEIRIPTFGWKQIGGDRNPGASGGVIATADGDAIEVIEIQPVREAVGDREAKDVGHPFWSKVGSYGLSDLSLSDPGVQSAIEYTGLGEHLLDMTPEQRAVAIAEACLQAGHKYDEGPAGWARDVIGRRVVEWSSGDSAGYEHIADEDDEFRRDVLELYEVLNGMDTVSFREEEDDAIEEAKALAAEHPDADITVQQAGSEVWNAADEEELEPNRRPRGAHRRNAEYPRKIKWPALFDHNIMDDLLDMAAESSDPSGRGIVPNEVKGELSFTDELIEAARDYEHELELALGEVVEKYPPQDGASAEDLFADDAPYLVLMGLMGHGVGIWDGRWDKHYSDTEPVEQLLKQRLGTYADSSGSGLIPQALMNAVSEAMERAGYEFDHEAYVKKEED